MPFTRERNAFQQVATTFRSRPDVQSAYLDAVADVVGNYNTSIFENRFTVGGAVELMTLLLLRKCGFRHSLPVKRAEVLTFIWRVARDYPSRANLRRVPASSILSTPEAGVRLVGTQERCLSLLISVSVTQIPSSCQTRRE